MFANVLEKHKKLSYALIGFSILLLVAWGVLMTRLGWLKKEDFSWDPTLNTWRNPGFEMRWRVQWTLVVLSVMTVVGAGTLVYMSNKPTSGKSILDIDISEKTQE